MAAWLADATNSVALTGAGMSTESGIPDYRARSGRWSQTRPVDYSRFVASAAARREYWNQNSEGHDELVPNEAHRVVASWEQTNDGMARSRRTSTVCTPKPRT